MGNDGNKLRSVYFQEYNRRNHTHYGEDGRPVVRYDGGVSTNGRRYVNKWDAWAEVITSNGLDIAEYVMAAFQAESIREPSDLVNSERLERYKTALDSGADVVDSWDAQERQLETQVKMRLLTGDSRERAILFVLHNKVIPVSPLVRYAVGKLNKVDVEEFREDAYQQYLAHKVWYDRQCPERIPEEFRC